LSTETPDRDCDNGDDDGECVIQPVQNIMAVKHENCGT